jgi:hypothetical protein
MGRTARLDTISGSKQLCLISLAYGAAAAPRGGRTSLISHLAAAANKQSNSAVQLQSNSAVLYLYINSTAELQYISTTVHQHYSTSALYKNPKGALQGAPKSGAVCVKDTPLKTLGQQEFEANKNLGSAGVLPSKNSQAASARRFLDKNSRSTGV